MPRDCCTPKLVDAGRAAPQCPAANRHEARHGFVRGALLLAAPQLDAADLPAPRLRQLADELDLARVLVRRRHALAVVLQLADERRPSRRRPGAARRTP